MGDLREEGRREDDKGTIHFKSLTVGESRSEPPVVRPVVDHGASVVLEPIVRDVMPQPTPLAPARQRHLRFVRVRGERGADVA